MTERLNYGLINGVIVGVVAVLLAKFVWPQMSNMVGLFVVFVVMMVVVVITNAILSIISKNKNN